MEPYVPTDVCPRCNRALVEVPVTAECRPHFECHKCKQVYVPHEGCKNHVMNGLHICEHVPEHVVRKGGA